MTYIFIPHPLYKYVNKQTKRRLDSTLITHKFYASTDCHFNQSKKTLPISTLYFHQLPYFIFIGHSSICLIFIQVFDQLLCIFISITKRLISKPLLYIVGLFVVLKLQKYSQISLLKERV